MRVLVLGSIRVLLFALLAVGLVGCASAGGNPPAQETPGEIETPSDAVEEPEPADTEPEEQEPADTEPEGPSFAGDYAWGDIPVYPGAIEVEKGEDWWIPSEARAFSDVEWLYYRLPATVIVGDVSLFYKLTMEEMGWLDQLWYQEAQDTAVMEFRRNMRSDGLHIWIQAKGEYTVFSLMRGWR